MNFSLITLSSAIWKRQRCMYHHSPSGLCLIFLLVLTSFALQNWNHALEVLFTVQSRSKSTTLLVYVTCFLWLIYVMATRTHRSSWHWLLCVCENILLHENCNSKSEETSIRFPLTVRGVAVFLHRTQQLKADSQTKEPKQDAEEVSKPPQQIHDFNNTGYDNGYKKI